MKPNKRILAIACSLLLLLPVTVALAGDDGAGPARFVCGDMTVDGLPYGSGMPEAREKFGDPPEVETHVDEMTGVANEFWHYDGLTLVFSPDKILIGALVTATGYPGPHDIQVGNATVYDLNLFYRSPNSPSSRIVYWNEEKGEFDPEKQPCAYLASNGDGTYRLVYVAEANPGRNDVVTREPAVADENPTQGETVTANEPDNSTYGNRAYLEILYNQSGISTEYKWYQDQWMQ